MPAEVYKALLERIEALHGKFDAFREEYLKEHQVVLGETRRAHDRIDTVEKELTRAVIRLAEVEKLMPWVKAAAYLVGGVSIPVILAAIAFIWQVVTHEIALLP